MHIITTKQKKRGEEAAFSSRFLVDRIRPWCGTINRFEVGRGCRATRCLKTHISQPPEHANDNEYGKERGEKTRDELQSKRAEDREGWATWTVGTLSPPTACSVTADAGRRTVRTVIRHLCGRIRLKFSVPTGRKAKRLLFWWLQRRFWLGRVYVRRLLERARPTYLSLSARK